MRKLVILLAAIFCISYSYTRNQDLIKYVNTLQGSHTTPDFSHSRYGFMIHEINEAVANGIGQFSVSRSR